MPRRKNPAYRYSAEVLRIVDGDTFDALVDVGFGAYRKIRVRVEGINTPETKGEEKPEGLRAKLRAEQLIEMLDVIIQSKKKDSFGRWISRVWLSDGRDFAQVMLDEGFAVPYKR